MKHDRPTLNLYADLAVIGMEYANGRMTRESFIEAATAMGLSPEQAKGRALTYDLIPLATCT